MDITSSTTGTKLELDYIIERAQARHALFAAECAARSAARKAALPEVSAERKAAIAARVAARSGRN
jgi:hypothetical protein